MEMAFSAAQKLGAQLSRIVQPELNAAFQAGPDRQDAGVAQNVKRCQHPAAEYRHHTAQNAALDLCGGCAMQAEQIYQTDGIFVRCGGGVGVQPPAEDQCIVFVAAHSDVGVADVDGKNHDRASLWRFIMYI